MRKSPLTAALLPLALVAAVTAIEPSQAAPQPAAPAGRSDPQTDTRLKTLEEDLRCLVCQNQSLADSPSEWADGMRAQIRDKIDEGATDQEIIDFLIARYGDFVTYKPPLKPSTYILWFGPVLVLLLAVAIVLLYVRRRAAATAPEALDEEQKQRARELLGGDRS